MQLRIMKSILADAKEWIEGAERQEAYAMKKTEKDIYDAMQSLEYEIKHALYIARTNAIYNTWIWTRNKSLRTLYSKGHLASAYGRDW